jgi:MbtH protein
MMTDQHNAVPDAPERFVVVVNHEEQYAIWPAGKPIPEKWREVGVSGIKEECLAHIKQVWTDMRPASVRMRHKAHGLDG